MSHDAESLPAALWVEILQHVPQQQRLTQCALVCAAWAPAAAQATVNVECELQSKALPAFRSWLAVNAGQIHSLKLKSDHVSGHHPPALWLPLEKLRQLQHLQLNGFKLHVTRAGNRSDGSPCSTGDNSGNAAGPLASLLHLELRRVKLESVSSLLQLTQAPQLRTLLLLSVCFTEFGSEASRQLRREANMQQLAAAMPGLLQQLPQLSVLQLEHITLSDTARHQLATLQRLQSLSFLQESKEPGFELQLLPNNITHLYLHSYGCSISPMLPRELTNLSGLLQLDLDCCRIAPAVLVSLTQLQVLRLENCDLLTVAPDTENDGAAGTAALLEVLPILKQLQELQLQVEGPRNWVTAGVATQRYSALTAPSHLTKLVLRRIDDAPLPKGAVQHMFPSSKQLHSLQSLEISTILHDLRFEPENAAWCLDSADLSDMIRACPSLQSFDITCSVQPGADLSVLSQLPHSCTELRVGGVAFTDAAAPVVAQLTQLQQLAWWWSPGFTITGLEHLVALNSDVSLNLEEFSLSETDVVLPAIVRDAWGTRSPGSIDLKTDPIEGSVRYQMGIIAIFGRRERERALAFSQAMALQSQLAEPVAEPRQRRLLPGCSIM